MTATTPETTVETLPYKNPDLPASERIADLLSRMTLEEKVGQCVLASWRPLCERCFSAV